MRDRESSAQTSTSKEKCQCGGRLQTRTRQGQPAELPNVPHLSPNCHSDPSLTPEGDCHMVLRKCKVEIGNSGVMDVGGNLAVHKELP
jgi:hypothetical protein